MRANFNQPAPKAMLNEKRAIWMEFPREKPRSNPGKGIHAAPGGRTIQSDSLADKLVLLGEVSMLGAIDSPSIHCLVDNTCGAISSPTEQGMFISATLKRMSKIKKILKGDRFFSPSLNGI